MQKLGIWALGPLIAAFGFAHGISTTMQSQLRKNANHPKSFLIGESNGAFYSCLLTHFSFLNLAFGILLQIGLYTALFLWKEENKASEDEEEPCFYLAISFVWGFVSAIWDLAGLSESCH